MTQNDWTKTYSLPLLEVDPSRLSHEELWIFGQVAGILQLETKPLSGIPLIAEKTEEKDLEVSWEDDQILIRYPNAVGFARGLSHVRELWIHGRPIKEKLQVQDSGLMLDVSRNAVLTVESVYLLLNYMATMGLNVLMLYTEDTYCLPSYPYFGYQRGAYTPEELKAIDDYAYRLGIEVVPCIQTLAHLATTLKWPYAKEMKDLPNILLVGEKKTYDFIEAMFKLTRSCLRSKRIHIGMDEAHSLGRGTYLDKNGYEEPYQIMQKHLAKVTDLAQAYGYTPMMWSDMYFRFCSPQNRYYDMDHPLTPEVLDSISDEVGLVYWDYYTHDPQVFDTMLARHLETKSPEVWFAGGVQTWNGIKANVGKAFATSELALKSCKKLGIDHVIATAWGDNGGEVSVFEPLVVLQIFGDFAWNDYVPSRTEVISRFSQTYGVDGRAFYDMRLFDEVPGVEKDNPHMVNPSKYILYSDPLMGTVDCHLFPLGDDLIDHYRDLAEYYDRRTNETEGMAKLFYLQSAQLADVLARKVRLTLELRPMYLDDDYRGLRSLVDHDLPDLIAAVQDYQAFSLSIWYLYNKPEGSEVLDIRMGGLLARLKTCQDRLDGYLNDSYDSLPELEAERLPFDGRSLEEVEKQPHFRDNQWQNLATVNPL